MTFQMPLNRRDDPGIGPKPSSFGAARPGRFELGEAATVMEMFLARPASDPMWSMLMWDALWELRSAFDTHVDEVEHPDGLLPRLVSDEPRLANGISVMYSDHGAIDLRLTQLTELICVCTPACEHTPIEEVRAETGDMLSLISLHRQAGADLVYEAYNVDIGGG
jgi:hypothetical protein